MLRKAHLLAGVAGLIVFVLQGQYMDLFHQHLAAMPDDGNGYELVEGTLRRMSPAGFRH